MRRKGTASRKAMRKEAHGEVPCFVKTCLVCSFMAYLVLAE
jgi:hypothetical protein